MFGSRTVARRRANDEAEKPFWISFADLMSALMVLFLVVMSVALARVTTTISAQEQAQKKRDQDIKEILARFDSAAAKFPGITVDSKRYVIDFGDRAQFGFNSSSLTPVQENLLRAFVPEILTLSNDELAKRILKRIVVEGFTDKHGSYLSNLNLSLQRSQRVLCALFATPLAGEMALTQDEREQIRALFLVGGYSFNSAKNTDALSRRVEMRLEFLGLGEKRPELEGVPRGNFGSCALGGP